MSSKMTTNSQLSTAEPKKKTPNKSKNKLSEQLEQEQSHRNGDHIEQGCQTHFHRGPHQPRSCLQRAEVILGLYKCNCSLTVEELKLYSAL